MKNRMKKWTGIFLAAVLLGTSFGRTAQAASKGYAFSYKSVTVYMRGNAAKLMKKAGKPISQKRSKSCAYSGLDGTYVYRDFILTTYSKTATGAQYVNSITFRNASVATKEGIRIGSTYNSVVKKYGKGKNRFGVYTFTKGSSKLQIEIEENKVSGIMYVAK